jgi:hypothetical protein
MPPTSICDSRRSSVPRPRLTDRRHEARVFALIGWLVCLELGLVGCARPSLDLARPPADSTLDDGAAGLVLRGAATGPLPGLGPRLEFAAWMRPGVDLRADLSFVGPSGPTHEILVWTPDAAVLFDRRRLRYTSLGESPGNLDTLGGSFHVGELWWLLVGGQEQGLLPSASWRRDRGQWRGKAAEKGYRRPVGEDPGWAELIWRDDDGRIHTLRAWRRQTLRLGPGQGTLATQLDLEGSDLEGRVRVRFDEFGATVLGDSILDPLWEPPGS